MDRNDWKVFYWLLVGVLVAVLMVMPYISTLFEGLLDELPISRGLALIITGLQTFFLFGLAALLGTKLTTIIPVFDAPLIRSLVEKRPLDINWSQYLRLSLGVGLAAAVVVVVGDYLFMLMGSPLSSFTTDAPPWWQGLMAAVYGGVGEEILIRYFFMTFVVFILVKLTKGDFLRPSDGIVWSALVIAAIGFGMLHLPATAALTPLTPIIILRGILLNGIPGVFFGLLFWKKGLESAIIAHFTADIVVHGLLVIIS